MNTSVSPTVSKLLHSSAVRKARENLDRLKGIKRKVSTPTPVLDKLTYLYEELNGLSHRGTFDAENYQPTEEDVATVLMLDKKDASQAPQMLAQLQAKRATAKARPKTQPAPRAIVTPAAVSKTPHFEQLERLKGNERTKYYNAHKAEIMAEARRLS